MPGASHGRRRPSDALCPSCERYIGPADACPYCGTDSARNPALRWLRYGALALAVFGLLFLGLMSAGRKPDAVRAAEITPMMNFAFVRVVGVVEREAHVGSDEGEVDYVSFVLNDGTGRVRVAAYDSVARDLVTRKLLPAPGSRVEAIGSLAVSARQMPRLRVTSPAQIGPLLPQGEGPKADRREKKPNAGRAG
jgi:hypothetical protein